MKKYVEGVFEAYINSCLCILYDRHYWDFETKNTTIEFFTALFKVGAGINFAFDAHMTVPKSRFATGGIVIPPYKTGNIRT